MAEQQLVTETSEKSFRELVFEEIYRLKLEKHALELEDEPVVRRRVSICESHHRGGEV